jgi:hypothetical protein
MTKSWKDLLLKSGLPLENDVKSYFDAQGCLSNFEYTYLRRDESQIEKEFSYDLDASLILTENRNWFDFLIECKYRHESTKWVFIPDSYGGMDEVHQNCFLHPMDHFVSMKFPFSGSFVEEFAPLCSRGVEIATTGDNDKSITQAVAQISYAFSKKVVAAIESQTGEPTRFEFINYHIPIIITTADLYRLREGVDIHKIKDAQELTDVADKHDCLVLKNITGSHLERYNLSVFEDYVSEVGEEKLQKHLNSHTKDLGHLFSVISKHYCPSGILVVQFTNSNTGLEKLFNYIHRISSPPRELIEKIEERDRASKQKWEEVLKSHKKPRKNKE